MEFVLAVFSQRRKKLRNAILNTNHMLKIPSVKEIIAQLPEDLMNKRAENLTPEQLSDVANLIVDLKSRETNQNSQT
jgi:16S rRNA (adenine1518-N6/adenine1519-N6)-dimethyltransferase